MKLGRGHKIYKGQLLESLLTYKPLYYELMTFGSLSQVLVCTFNQDKTLVRAFSVIVKLQSSRRFHTAPSLAEGLAGDQLQLWFPVPKSGEGAR